MPTIISFGNQCFFAICVNGYQCAAVRLCCVFTENEHRVAQAPGIKTKKGFGETHSLILCLSAGRDIENMNRGANFSDNAFRLSYTSHRGIAL